MSLVLTSELEKDLVCGCAFGYKNLGMTIERSSKSGIMYEIVLLVDENPVILWLMQEFADL